VRLRRKVINFLLVEGGLRRLHGTRVQRLVRDLLDEVDMQHLKDSSTSAIAFADRGEMYRYVAEQLVGDTPIDFLEFGVFRGESIGQWTAYHQHPESRFYGFDSFEGLPEDWRGSQKRGHFSVSGALPQIEDPRVRFIKGWFDSTVPAFVGTFVPRNRIVVHLDADLYASTLVPLIHLNVVFSRGTILMFDEFYDRDNEFKAFRDYLRITRRSWRVLCHVDDYKQVCVELD
jgi:O-methyltransferase